MVITSNQKSLSARRAWIEMTLNLSNKTIIQIVALRKESVDRNPRPSKTWAARWVALRKESVDRNTRRPLAGTVLPSCRSPQGERG